MGVVYKARQIGLNRLVALKMILAGGHAGPDAARPGSAPRPRRSPGLQHPNIVQIYEVGEHDGLPYFALEYVRRRQPGRPDRARAAAAATRGRRAGRAAGPWPCSTPTSTGSSTAT